MRLILTSGIEIENYFDFLTGFIETDLSDLQTEFSLIHPNDDYDIPELMRSFILSNSGQDILINGGINRIERYHAVRDHLASVNITIESVYIKNDESYDELSETEKKDIDIHSRWTGNTSEELEYIQNQNNQKLQEMATAIEQDGVTVIWID